jgi:hypothetical protein
MTETTSKLINGTPVVGVCQNCGREFLTMPGDGRDHYAPAGSVLRRYDPDPGECGGRIERCKAAP